MCNDTDTITYETTQDRTSLGETTDTQTQSTGDHTIPVSPPKEEETILAHNRPPQPAKCDETTQPTCDNPRP
jgi:hypothetical protein